MRKTPSPPRIRLADPSGPLGRYWTVVFYGWLAVVVSAAPHVPVPIRAFVVFTFVLFGPGIPIIGLIRVRGPLEHFVLAATVSISLATILAEGMALAGKWSAVGGLAALAGATTIAAVLQGSRERAGGPNLDDRPPNARLGTAPDAPFGTTPDASLVTAPDAHLGTGPNSEAEGSTP